MFVAQFPQLDVTRAVNTREFENCAHAPRVAVMETGVGFRARIAITTLDVARSRSATDVSLRGVSCLFASVARGGVCVNRVISHIN